MGRRVAVRVPATTANVGSGFDCIGIALDLYDDLSLTLLDDPRELTIEVSGEGAGGVPRLKKNMYNVMHNIYRASSKDVLWTTYKEQEAALSGRGYAGGFLPFNTRSVNEFGDRHYLLYGANIFMNAGVRSLFRSLGVEVDEEQYALSMMLQWLWRSAIRNGEDIYIYVPSSRMRHLLEDWLSETGA